jgi:hypothetical protein
LEEPTDKSVSHQDKNKDIFKISRKPVFEVSTKEISPIPLTTRRLLSRRRGRTAVAINRFTKQKTFGKHISYQAQI